MRGAKPGNHLKSKQNKNTYPYYISLFQEIALASVHKTFDTSLSRTTLTEMFGASSIVLSGSALCSSG